VKLTVIKYLSYL